MSTLARLRTGLLALGTAFSWMTLADDFNEYFFGFSVSNPFLTPCFYGAIAFFAAFVLSVLDLEKILVGLLVGGTLFAWGSFGLEAWRFYFPANAPSGFSCPPVAGGDPLLQPCFYGALIFTAALAVALASLLRHLHAR